MKGFGFLKNWVTIGLAMLALNASAYDPTQKNLPAHQKPDSLQGVGLDVKDKLGTTLPLGLGFTDDQGQQVTLGKYFDGTRPVILSMVYFECPSLCNYHLNGLTETLKAIKWTPGQDYRLVAVSMNHRENSKLAAAKKQSYIEEFGRAESESGWHFLTGSEANVKKLAEALGFGFKWDPMTNEYAHAAAAYVNSSGGVISRVIPGIEFESQTLKLALLEASKGKIGSVVDQIVLFCFQFDPAKNKYTLYAYNVMRLGALLAMFLLALFLIPQWLREKRKPEHA